MTAAVMPIQIEDVDLGPSVEEATVRIEASPRWVRAFLDGKPIADSKRARLVFEPRRLPVYYFPAEDVCMHLLRPSDRAASGSEPGSPRQRWTFESGGRVVDDVGWSHVEPDATRSALTNHIAFYWAKVDAWFEEDEQVFVHARDPHKRVDVMPSSRDVKVIVDGETVAETTRPYLLFETGLPTRYYIPRTDVRFDLLEPSQTTTQCPYKGRAEYWSVRIGGTRYPDLVWSYAFPIPECPKIAQLMAFFNEKVDIVVDGELQQRPVSPWS
jgi:uncharacterized protein (DUF427 family)